MKKVLSVISILTVLLLLCSFSKNKEVKLTGNIISYGNMPFNYPVLKTENNKKYSIKASDEIKKNIFTSTGRKICVKGLIIEPDKDVIQIDSAEDGYIEVIEWNYVK